MTEADIAKIKNEAREEGRLDAEKAQAKSEVQYHLVKHLIWFVVGCIIGGWAAADSTASAGVVFWCAVGTGIVFSFIKWIIWAVVLSTIGC